ncbi:RNA-directed DNA polymerase [Inquilinus limosus]|uniref:RNA-directed DNA polymerase n=1 Tax=Inquilinus limosus TaxID=171674 RepID=UPI000A60BD61|nr:RNA-directed DNA polymerase [Inquilinus limosus]
MNNDLKADLLKKGYLPENMPPSFISDAICGFFDTKAYRTFLSSSATPVRPAVYNASKRGMTRRTFSVVHPVSGYDLAEFAATRWGQIEAFFGGIKNSLSAPRHSPDGDRALEISPHSELEAVRLSKLSQYRFIAKTDISRFYHSIYTHSIPWAYHGKALSKDDRNPRSNKVFFNRLDYIVRCGQDGQTVGIPVGPDASRIIAETVSTAIDLEFFKRCDVEDCDILRHVDDVWIGANSHADAERALWRYREAIREYELDINENKTKIYAEDFRFSDGWPTDVAAQLEFAIDSPVKRIAERLRTAFEYAFSFTTSGGDDGVLKYAIRYLDQSDLRWGQWETFEPFLKRSAVHFGHTIDYVVRVLVWKNLTSGAVDNAAWSIIFRTILDRQGRLGNDSEVCWAIYGCMRFAIKIDIEIAKNIVWNCGAMSIVALLNCVELDLVDADIFDEALEVLAGESLCGPYWPVLLEWISRGWPGKSKIAIDHDVIKEMGNQNVTLFDSGRLPKVFQDVDESNFSDISEAIEKRVSIYDDEDAEPESPF